MIPNVGMLPALATVQAPTEVREMERNVKNSENVEIGMSRMMVSTCRRPIRC